MNEHGMEPVQGFWAALASDERAVLTDLGRVTVYPPGAVLCVEGDPATHVFVLVEGWVKILGVTSDGHELTLALRGHGDTVGEVAGETSGYRTATVQAVGTVRALIVPYLKFSSFLDTHSGADHAYRRMVTRRWTDAESRLRQRAATSGAQRLAGLLLELAGQRDSEDADPGGAGQPDRGIARHGHPRAEQLATPRPHPDRPARYHHPGPKDPAEYRRSAAVAARRAPARRRRTLASAGANLIAPRQLTGGNGG
jgi:CRP-like cAMP-binding protein